MMYFGIFVLYVMVLIPEFKVRMLVSNFELVYHINSKFINNDFELTTFHWRTAEVFLVCIIEWERNFKLMINLVLIYFIFL